MTWAVIEWKNAESFLRIHLFPWNITYLFYKYREQNLYQVAIFKYSTYVMAVSPEGEETQIDLVICYTNII